MHSVLVYSSLTCCSWFCTGIIYSYACHIFAPVFLLYSQNVTFPHYTKSTAAGRSQIEFPSRSVKGHKLLFLITNASGDVVTYQLKEQLGHQVAPLLQTTSHKTKNANCQWIRQATCLKSSSFLYCSLLFSPTCIYSSYSILGTFIHLFIFFGRPNFETHFFHCSLLKISGLKGIK